MPALPTIGRWTCTARLLGLERVAYISKYYRNTESCNRHAMLRALPLTSGLLVSLTSRLPPRRSTWISAAISVTSMQKAIVKMLPEESNLTITLTLGGKLRNLDRAKDEVLEKPLSRIQKSVAPPQDKRQKRQKGKQPQGSASDNGTVAAVEPPGPVVVLYAGSTTEAPAVDAATTSNVEAWQHGRLLQVGQDCYQVVLNPPIADRLDIPLGIFVGIPVYPLLTAHFTEEEVCRWRWLRRGSASSAWQEVPEATARLYTPAAEDAGCRLRVECTPARRSSPPSDGSIANGCTGSSNGGSAAGPREALTSSAGTQEAATEELDGEEGEALPNGALLYGEPIAAECGPVRRPPSPLGIQPRLALTQRRAQAPEFRVVTYNILADQYAATEKARKLLFGYCPPECLVPEYRRPLILAELLGLTGDILCLQEVDDKMFSQLLQPQLGAAGYQGVYTNKAGKVREGSALFFRRDRFRLVAQRDLALKEFFPPTPHTPSPYEDVFAPMLRTSPQLLHALQRIGTIAQLALLVPVGDASGLCRPLLVANTHLFFHYAAPHIRTMHTWVIMQEAHRLREEALGDPALSQQLGGQRPSLLFCGDLNSDLNDGIPGAIELLGKGRLSADFWDWHYGVGFKWGMSSEEEGSTEGEEEGGAVTAAAAATGEESGGEFGELGKMVHSSLEHAHPEPTPDQPQSIVPGVELEIPFQLASADRLRSSFTNYVRGYQGLLDYIWYCPDDVEVVQEVPLPTLGELGGYLPSPRFPSDHLPVVFDLRFRRAADLGEQPGQRGRGEERVLQQEGHLQEPQHEPQQGLDGEAAAAGEGRPGNVLAAAFYNVPVAVEALQVGSVIAVPTDTVYGLAANASSAESVAAVYRAKGREPSKALAVCVADPADVAQYAQTQHLPDGLVKALLPGPVTLLLERKEGAPLSPSLNPGLSTIGLRIPDAPFLRAVCQQLQAAVVLTSANASHQASSAELAEFEELWPACAAVFDGGALGAGRAGSTVVDLTEPGRFRVAPRGAGFAEAVSLLTNKYGLVHVF